MEEKEQKYQNINDVVKTEETSSNHKDSELVIISPKAYFKTMLSILYSITSPFTTSIIDYETGKILYK